MQLILMVGKLVPRRVYQIGLKVWLTCVFLSKFSDFEALSRRVKQILTKFEEKKVISYLEQCVNSELDVRNLF